MGNGDILTAACEWVARGVAVFPVNWETKYPLDPTRVNPETGERDVLLAWKPYQTRLTTPDELWAWFGGAYPVMSYAVVTGWRDLVLLDWDNEDAHREWLEWAAATGGIAERVAFGGYQVRTKKGYHVYCYVTEDGRAFNRPGLNVLRAGKYAVGAGSLHPSGVRYTQVVGTLEDIPRAPNIAALLPVVEDASNTYTRPNAAQTAQPVAVVTDPWEAIVQPPQPREPIPMGTAAAVRELVLCQWFVSGLQMSGDHFLKGRCPLHGDENPSFWINTAKNRWGCQAGCVHGSASVIDLYMLLHGGMNHLDAMRELAQYLPNGGIQ